MGEATAQMAAADPGTGILAVDVHTPGQGNLLNLADRAGLSNLRVANGDAIILLREMLAPDSLAGLRVYFPDPWPKKRHHKRRLIQPEFLTLAASRLKPGALRALRDGLGAVRRGQMLEVLTAHPDFENTQPDGGYAPRPDFRPLTRFEGQGLDKGHVVNDLLFRRVRHDADSDERRSSRRHATCGRASGPKAPTRRSHIERPAPAPRQCALAAHAPPSLGSLSWPPVPRSRRTPASLPASPPEAPRTGGSASGSATAP